MTHGTTAVGNVSSRTHHRMRSPHVAIMVLSGITITAGLAAKSCSASAVGRAADQIES